MQMPVAVGVVLAIIFLVAFSEWFYHMVKGWGELVIDDMFFYYRIAGATILSIVVMCSTFFIAALVTECPNKQREGILASLRCDEYLQIKASTDKIFSKQAEIIETEDVVETGSENL